jgi:hypothetical protein
MWGKPFWSLSLSIFGAIVIGFKMKREYRAIPTMACPTSIHSTRPSPYPRVHSATNLQRRLVKAAAPPHPENKRVWSSLLHGKTAVMEEGAEEMQRRDPLGAKIRLALRDGERAYRFWSECPGRGGARCALCQLPVAHRQFTFEMSSRHGTAVRAAAC